MSITEQSHLPSAHMPDYTVTPLRSSLRKDLTLSPQINPETGEHEGLLNRALGHRVDLVPKSPEDTVDYAGRHNKTSYVYRRGIFSSVANPVPASFGNRQDEVYQIPTRWLPRHPGAALSLLTRHGEWNLMTFASPVEAHELPKLPKEQILSHRQQMPPIHRA